MSDEILEIARGNARLAEGVRELLRLLLKHENEMVREMARDALDGASLRQMAASSVYADEMGAEIGNFWQEYQKMTPEERAELAKASSRYFEGPAEPVEEAPIQSSNQNM